MCVKTVMGEMSKRKKKIRKTKAGKRDAEQADLAYGMSSFSLFIS